MSPKPVSHGTGRAARTERLAHQSFLAPSHAPFLEIRTTLGSTLPYAEHFHATFSFGLILEGQTRCSIEGIPYVVEAGDMVLIAPAQAHSCNPVGGNPRSYHMVFVDAAWLREHVGSRLGMKDGLEPCKPVIRDAGLFAGFLALVEAQHSAGSDTANSLIHLFLELNKRHNCFLPAAEGRRADILPSDAAAWTRLLEEHEPRVPSVSWLANIAGIRRESFSRSVRRKTGLPPSDYLHCLRLEKGRQMLRRGEAIAEAALASGYVDQSHFHRAFVKYYSVTPGCYRRGASQTYKK